MKRDFLKMLLIAILPICAVSCIDNVPKVEVLPRDAVSFEYFIDQNTESKYYLDYYVDSDITFKNTSPESTQGEPTWDFGDGHIQTGDDVVHFYEKAGTYKVRLTIGDYSAEQNVMIAPIRPIVKVKVADPVCEVRKSLVTFEVELPNPKNKPATFAWTFPTDTKNAEDAEYATFTGKDINDLPAPVKFSHVGSQTVTLNVTLGDEELESTLLNVQVAYDKDVPTLYYAVQGGRIMAHKLTGGAHPADMNIASYDLGVASGQHPFNILFKDSLLYVLDAGKQFYYVDDTNGVLGDGKISVVSKDGAKVQTMITNAGQAAFDDPFYGCIDGDFLYYTNRNTGIMKVKLTDRDKVYNITEYPYFVRHNHLHYYGVGGLAYGAVSRNIAKINGVWHWSTCHTSTSTFCFMEDDILSSPVTQGEKDKLPEEGKICDGLKIGSFYYSSKHDQVVFCAMGTTANCISVCSYAEWKAMVSEGDVAKKAVKFDGKDFASNLDGNLPAVEGTGVESVGITQIAYDDMNECVYFAYRNNGKVTDRYPNTGIYCYSFKTQQITCLIEGVSAYGVAVNNNPAKLF
jgi:PKD repeat protein